jgi:release factor glutamine methyltransferase
VNAVVGAGLTVAAARRGATERLAEAGADAPALDAELLLAHVLQCERVALLTCPERRLTERERHALDDLVGRRAEREPLAYILGRREFYGLVLEIGAGVLIPRPETEELVERAVDWLRRQGLAAPTVADVGTGSGAIAIALAHVWPSAGVYALEASPTAAAVARRNIERWGLSDRITLLTGDLLAPLATAVNLIVANLPYIATAEVETLMPEVARYEPRLALDGGADGLDVIRRLLAQAPSRLLPGGALFLEIGASQGPAARAAAEAIFPSAETAVYPDLAGHDRILMIQSPAGDAPWAIV